MKPNPAQGNEQETHAAPDVQPKMKEPLHQRHHEKTVVMAFIAVGVIVVLGFFIVYFFMRLISGGPGNDSGAQNYNGFEFTKRGNSWFTEWQRADGTEYSLEFRHPPWEAEGIPVKGSVDARFQLPYIFITFDPAEEPTRGTAFVALAAADLTMMLRGVFEREGVAAGCTANLTEACAKRPVVTCSTNASVIYLKVSNETGIFLDGNCATIQGYEEGMTKAADKALYQWLGIIKE
ncbi:hypothetical protein HYU17_06035 [Candidatus Woesearchaeota archaeon]|nr:hypothetical protein [Candidatus Woesearchaeota archaeon]